MSRFSLLSGIILFSFPLLSAAQEGNPPVRWRPATRVAQLPASPQVQSTTTPRSSTQTPAGGITSTFSPNTNQQNSAHSTATRVSKGAGVLPNDHGQVWREYDIRPYTNRVTTTNKPEQAIIDWILRETGTEVWFSEPYGALSAEHGKISVYHTPEMQTLVKEVIDRFTSSQAESYEISLRLMTVNSPNWRSKAHPLMQRVEVQSPGIDAWLISKENAALLIAELRRRTDFQQHNSPQHAHP